MILGILGLTLIPKGASIAFQKAKTRYYERNFDKFIRDVNANKPTKPLFEKTKELEKKYRENILHVKDELSNKLGLKGKVYADYVRLAEKHPEYFSHPQDAKMLTEYIAQNPTIALPASKIEYEAIMSELDMFGIKGGKGIFVLDLEFKGGKHRVKSVHLISNKQYREKINKAKKQGSPTYQF